MNGNDIIGYTRCIHWKRVVRFCDIVGYVIKVFALKRVVRFYIVVGYLNKVVYIENELYVSDICRK